MSGGLILLVCTVGYIAVGAYAARWRYVRKFREVHAETLPRWHFATKEKAYKEASEHAHNMAMIDALMVGLFWPFVLPCMAVAPLVRHWFRAPLRREEHADEAREAAAKEARERDEVIAEAEKIVRDWKPPQERDQR